MQQLKVKGQAMHWERSAFIQHVNGTTTSSMVLKLNTSINVSENFWNQLLSALAKVADDEKKSDEPTGSISQFTTVTHYEFKSLPPELDSQLTKLQLQPGACIETKGFGGGKLPPHLPIHAAYLPKNLEGFYQLMSLLLHTQGVKVPAETLKQKIETEPYANPWKRIEKIKNTYGIVFFNLAAPPPDGLKNREKLIFIQSHASQASGQTYIFFIPKFPNFVMVDPTPIASLITGIKKGNHLKYYEERIGKEEVWPELSFTATLCKPDVRDTLRDVIAAIGWKSKPIFGNYLFNYEIGICHNPDRVLLNKSRTGSCNFEVKFHIPSEQAVVYTGGLGEHFQREIVLNVHIDPPCYNTPAATPAVDTVVEFRNQLAVQLNQLWGKIDLVAKLPVLSSGPLSPDSGTEMFPGGFNTMNCKVKELPTKQAAAGAAATPAVETARRPISQVASVLAPSSAGAQTTIPNTHSSHTRTFQAEDERSFLKRGRDPTEEWEERRGHD